MITKLATNIIKNIDIVKLNLKDTNFFKNKYPDVNIKHDIYTLLHKNKHIGGIAINTNPNNTMYNTHDSKPNVAVSWFYVDNKYRNLGLGNKLFEHIMRRYPQNIGLTTGSKSNQSSKNIYKKYGFKVINDRRNTQYWYRK